MGRAEERTAISGPAALRLVHRWRSESDAILVGTVTALTDNPRLDTRFYFGKNPLRVVFDREGKIPPDFHLLDNSTETWVFGEERHSVIGRHSSDEFFKQTKFFPTEGKVLIASLLEKLFEANRAILLVEGGANVLSQFLKKDFWDEIRIIENERRLGGGVAVPNVPSEAVLKEEFRVGEDVVQIFEKK